MLPYIQSVTTMKTLRASVILIIPLALLSGCVGKQPFLSVQLCLHDEQNLKLFVDTMKSISQSQGMDYGDRSAASQSELTSLNVSPNYPLINISANGKDNVGWGATNLTLFLLDPIPLISSLTQTQINSENDSPVYRALQTSPTSPTKRTYAMHFPFDLKILTD